MADRGHVETEPVQGRTFSRKWQNSQGPVAERPRRRWVRSEAFDLLEDVYVNLAEYTGQV